jgi:hypothetical protein
MDSLALLEPKKSLENSSIGPVDLHVNLWKNGKNCFLDIGIKIKEYKHDSGVIFLYVKDLQCEDVEDLSPKLTEATLLNAIFNENYRPTPAIERYTDVQSAEKSEDKFTICPIVKKLDDKSQCLEISWTSNQSTKEEAKNLYLRFRIKGDFINGLSQKEHLSRLQELAYTVDTIDIRINQRRNLTKTPLMNDNTKQFLKFKSINCFVIRSIKDQYTVSSRTLKSVRKLESLWAEKYIEKEFCDKTFAYQLQHRREGEPLDDFGMTMQFKILRGVKFWLLGYFTLMLINYFFTKVLDCFISLFTTSG